MIDGRPIATEMITVRSASPTIVEPLPLPTESESDLLDPQPLELAQPALTPQMPQLSRVEPSFHGDDESTPEADEARSRRGQPLFQQATRNRDHAEALRIPAIAQDPLPQPEEVIRDDISELPESLAFEPTDLGTEPDELPEQLATNRPPAYPDDALRRRLQGQTMLRIVVASDGIVGRVTVERSSGHPSLDDAAVRAAREWRFSPARRRGTAIEDEVLVPVRFSLRR